LRRGKARKGECISFLNGRNESVRGRILKKNEGNLEDVLNATTYKKIIPTAKNLNEALDFVKKIYQSTEGEFTAYEFEIESEKGVENSQRRKKAGRKRQPI
jgi:ASC-1-like (ASCH) protein